MSDDIILGSGEKEYPKTPTLRQFLSNPANSCPIKNYVSIVFRPNKSPNWSFVAKNGFRVNVLEDNPLFTAITDNIDQWAIGDSPLFIRVEKGSTGAFSIGLDNKESSTWEETSYGYRITLDGRTQTRKSAKQHG